MQAVKDALQDAGVPSDQAGALGLVTAGACIALDALGLIHRARWTK